MEQSVITFKQVVNALDFLEHKPLLPLEQRAYLNQYGTADMCRLLLECDSSILIATSTRSGKQFRLDASGVELELGHHR